MNDIVNIISSVGFPICCALGCAYFIKWLFTENLKQQEDLRKQQEEMRKEHKEEVTKMTEAINNNNTLLQRLLDRLDKEG